MWWWLLGIFLVGCVIALVAAKCIKFGSADNEDDYMIGDDYNDWGDKS